MRSAFPIYVLGALAVGAPSLSGPVRAAVVSFPLCLRGGAVVGDPGDPDGSARGAITFDTATGEITWSVTYFNVEPPTLWVIHEGVAGVGGPAFISLGVSTTGGPGTLISSHDAEPAQVNAILANPRAFYIDFHNHDFPNGALRGQVEEPARRWDLTGDCIVNSEDLAQLLAAWGTEYNSPELAQMLASWGPTP
jgi:hypothetical protein